MSGKTTPTIINDVPTFQWRALAEYAPGVEIISMPHLFHRGSRETDKRSTRFNFFFLAGVSAGSSNHAVDFLEIPCCAGTWLLVHPGKLQQFDYSEGLNGWVILFRSDFLPPCERGHQAPFNVLTDQLCDFPEVIQLEAGDHATCCAIVESMCVDLKGDIGNPDSNALLLYQLCTLLTRLKIAHSSGERRINPVLKMDWQRVGNLRKLIDLHFCAQHGVNWYASALGCTIKTLGRAARTVTGLTVKTMIAERIILEAKRKLVHTRHRIQTIAHDLELLALSEYIFRVSLCLKFYIK